MKLKLDAKTVAGLALTKGRDEEFAWDLEVPNFGLRLRRSGDGVQRTYVAQYRAGGRTRRVRLGVAEHLSPTQAREAARKVLAKVALGGDPQAEKQAKKAEAGQTFTAMVEKYLEAKQPDLRKVSFRLTKLYLLGPYFRSLHSMGVAAITRDHIADRLTVITKRHSAYTAATAQRHLSTFFRWLMEEGWVAANPVIRTPKPKKAKARERVLDDGELVAVWNATGGDNDHDRIVRLQILTGARRAEIGGMRWSEIDRGGKWTLPAVRAKNHRTHSIVLPKTALEILNKIPRLEGRDHVFGDRADAGFTSWHFAKSVLDRRLVGTMKESWRLHDLRRTAVTGMANLGIQPHIIEATINHVSGHKAGVGGIYNRAVYTTEVKIALARWSAHVHDLVAGRRADKVVHLRKA
jgi:integrase